MKAESSFVSPLLVLLALTLLAGPLLPSAFSAQGSGKSVPLHKIYSKAPSYQTQPGSFSSGIVLVDLDKDGYDDLVLANGIDVTPQPLSIYYNQLASPGGTLFGEWPDWYSQRIGYQVAVASGDIDQDGWLDLVVLEAYNLRHDVGSGGFTIYRNDGHGSLVFSGRIPIPGSLPLGCTLADVDADGDLDLAIAAYTEKSSGLLRPGRGRVYLNEEGTFSPQAAWTTADPIWAAGVTAADINQDGWMDLAFAADRPVVYYGGPEGIDATAGWTGGFQHPYSSSVDAGRLKTEARRILDVPSHESLTLAISASASSFTFKLCQDNCGFFLYDPQGIGTWPIWQSGQAQGAKLLLADLNDDGYLDLVGSQSGPLTLPPPGAPLLFFQGGEQGFGAEPSFQTSEKVVGQGLALANIHNKREKIDSQIFRAKEPVAVLTLPRRVVTVLGVTKNGQPLPYAWAPGANWISLAEPLSSGDSVVVKYQYSRRLDVAAANWNALQANQIYLSQ